LLDAKLSTSVEDLVNGPLPPVLTAFADGTSYRAILEVYGVAGSGDTIGLTDSDLRRLRVTVHWRDAGGPHHTSAETYLARLPR
jgi:hypothetical protein